MDNDIEMLGLSISLEKKLHEKNEAAKRRVKDNGINITNDTCTIKLSDTHIKVYTDENQKKIDKIKRKCAEAIAAIPFEKVEVKNYSATVTSSVDADKDAELIIDALSNPNTKDRTIKLIKDLLA